MNDAGPHTVLLVLPQFDLSSRDYNRCLLSLKVNFGNEIKVTTAAAREWISRHAQLGIIPGPYDRAEAVNYDRIVFIERGDPAESLALGGAMPRRVYRFDFTWTYFRARLRTVGYPEDASIYPNIDSHIFAKLAPSGSDFFYYFPYGYLFRCLGLGPLNDFGYRHRPYEELVDRPPHHKVIAFFGGSSCWSLDCLHPEMHTERLERRLNDWAKSTGRELVFTVMNCGQHGNVVLNSMLAYMLFLNKKRPIDLVIGHDGFNDFVYGMFADPALMAEKICYQDNLEGWSRILHGTASKPARLSEIPFPIQNTPARIIDAYVTRKMQFQKIVEADGGKFIWGLQPFIKNKTALSPLEEEHLTQAPADDAYLLGYGDTLALLYDMIRQLPKRTGVDFVDVSKAIAPLGREFPFFVDRIHTTPEGDDFIAQTYFTHITEGIGAGRYFA